VDTLSEADAADDVPEQTPQSFPDAPILSPWLAASWRAFGTYDTPLHITRHRSFDGGIQRLPDEPSATYAARQNDHRRFDDAERELMDLLAAGYVKATGQPPARAASGQCLHHAVPGHVHIQANVFLDRQLAFASSGELIQRLPTLSRVAPPHDLLGSDADPRFPLYHNLLIETAGLRKAWNVPYHAADASDPSPSTPTSTVVRAPTAEYSKKTLGGWFLLRVGAWSRDHPPPNEEADYVAAKEYFGKIPRDEFREIRKEKTPPEWWKRGPRGPRI
jgi:hypothetical protein